MDKKELRNVISAMKNGDQVTVNFRGDLAKLNGQFTVLNVKKGKGKGGSLLAELSPASGTESIVVGTPDSDNVLNVVVNGTLHGYETENDVPLVIAPDAGKAASLKEQLRQCEAGSTILVSSELLSEFNGVFRVVSVKPSKGRYGQVVASLKDGNGSVVELWSYRHSGAIDSIEKV